MSYVTADQAVHALRDAIRGLASENPAQAKPLLAIADSHLWAELLFDPLDIQASTYIVPRNESNGQRVYGVEVVYLPDRSVARAHSQGSSRADRLAAFTQLKNILKNRANNVATP